MSELVFIVHTKNVSHLYGVNAKENHNIGAVRAIFTHVGLEKCL